MNGCGQLDAVGREKETGGAEFTCGCWLGLEWGLASQRNASKCRRAGATAKGIEVGKGPVGRCLAPKAWECSKGRYRLGSSKRVSANVSQQVSAGFLD